ncbi:hypothetical protein [Cellvibrio sp. NN19]|uniref:hypothetical protein n=1 Tax=Cellvibrio chitinivorans TaxID=3102792 RepID=UPI002B40F2D9|nr:hypothetical protein [Cellvibrio sp. NN19]
MNICPKCHYQRQPIDQHIHADICPSCGIVYSKFIAKQTPQPDTETEDIASTEFEYEASESLRQKISAAFLYVPERIDPGAFWTRVALLIGFIIWGGYFITAGVDWEKIGGSFMHNINLPFHEFGHLLFMPFGTFMMFLGGSLFQIFLPLICLCVFVFKQRDTFAGSIMLWWCGQSFIDLAPYIADAEYRALPLVGGGGEESHDWGNLLTMMNALEHTHAIANGCFTMGSVIIVATLLWAGWILKLQKQKLVSFYDSV